MIEDNDDFYYDELDDVPKPRRIGNFSILGLLANIAILSTLVWILFELLT